MLPGIAGINITGVPVVSNFYSVIFGIPFAGSQILPLPPESSSSPYR